MSARKATTRRAVESSVKPDDKIANLKTLAAKFYRANKEANSAKGVADKTRKELYKGMKESKLTHLELSAIIDDKEVMLDADIGCKDVDYIDVSVLRGLVSAEQFDRIIEASKKSVEDVAGKDIAIRATKTKTGTENVSVKPREK